MKRTIVISILVLITFVVLNAQNNNLNEYFEKASSKYNIPLDLLKSIAYVESRYYQNIPNELSPKDRPLSYGIMGLRNDEWFGNSLLEGAKLINQPIENLIYNEYYNIMGAAAVLSKYADELRINRSNINFWKPVIEKYSGIPQNDVKEFYSYDVFKVLYEGNELNGIVVSAHPDIDMDVFPTYVKGNSQNSIKSDDYGPAVWDPSPNYTANAISQQFAVVHVTEGSFASAVSWLKNPSASASAHYVIRSSDGYIVQLVREKDRAWHAVCWNAYMLGVEHEGYVSNPSWFTDAMYLASGALFRHFCLKYNIPFSRNRIIGHGEWQNSSWVSWMQANYPNINPTCNNHTDPGVYWDWPFYMQLISQDTTKPNVVSYSPAQTDTAWVNTSIKITFSQRMEKTSTQAAFSISPNVSGSFSWENNGRTLVFKPSSLLTPNTRYYITLNNTAKNYVNITLPNTLNFNFLTKFTSTLSVLSTYPLSNQSNIVIQPEIKIKFDAPLDQSTIAQNVVLVDSLGVNTIPISAIGYSEENGISTLSFSPLSKLRYRTVYQVLIKTGLKNVQGTGLANNTYIRFTTQINNFLAGQVFDNLEVIGNWKDPNYSGSTVGTDPEKTTFTIVSDKKIDGSFSGKITYVFTGSNGVCRTFNATKPSVGSDLTKRFGVWIYGDMSYNYLEFWFYYNTTSNVILRVDTLNWAGWKFIEFPLSNLNQTGEILFHSVVIVQNPNGSATGQVYIDAMQTRSRISSLAAPLNLVPANNSTLSNATFRWSTVNNATYYQIQLSTDSLFSSTYLNNYAYNDTSIYLSFDNALRLFWRVRAINQDVTGSWSNPTSFNTIGTDMKNEIPEMDYVLYQNYPNPFNPSTSIKFNLKNRANVKIIIYDVLGRFIKELVNETKPAGTYTIYWNGDDMNGDKVASGTYIYELIAGNDSETYRAIKKMNLVK